MSSAIPFGDYDPAAHLRIRWMSARFDRETSTYETLLVAAPSASRELLTLGAVDISVQHRIHQWLSAGGSRARPYLLMFAPTANFFSSRMKSLALEFCGKRGGRDNLEKFLWEFSM